MPEDQRVASLWARRWRLPLDLPDATELPVAGEGEVLVRHHCSEKVVGRFAPATGRVGGLVRLDDWPPSGVGRWLPLRSGNLATWRAGGERLVQHRRRRIAIPRGTRCEAGGAWAVRRLTTPGGRLWMLDAPRRWEGGLLVRAFDTTAFMEPEDFDLIRWIAWRSAREG